MKFYNQKTYIVIYVWITDQHHLKTRSAQRCLWHTGHYFPVLPEELLFMIYRKKLLLDYIIINLYWVQELHIQPTSIFRS